MWRVWFGKQQPTLLDEATDASTISIPEGFYFIVNANISKEDAANIEALSAIADDLMVGDWLVVVGTGDTARWVKVDNTDAIKSINGKFGAVMLKGEDGVTIQAGSFEVSGNNTDITIKGTTYTLEKAANKIRLVDNNNKVINEVISGIHTLNGLNGTGIDGNCTGDLEIVAGENINVYTDADTKITIDAKIPKQVQADWNENDPESSAYIKNRTHYSGDSVEIVHLESPNLGGPPEGTGYVFKAGETYDIQYWFRDKTYRSQFTVTPGTGNYGDDHCLIGSFPQDDLSTIDIYLCGGTDGEFTGLVSHGSGALNEGMLNIYTVGVKQLDAKYIPVDNETIRIENGKLVGAANSNVDLSNVDQDINVVNGHSVNISGDLNIEGGIAFGNLAATSLKVTNEPTEDDDVVNLKYFRENAGQGGNVDLTGDVTIGGNLEVGGDLKFNGDFEIASLDAQSVKVNGKRVLVEGDVAGGMPELNTASILSVIDNKLTTDITKQTTSGGALSYGLTLAAAGTKVKTGTTGHQNAIASGVNGSFVVGRGNFVGNNHIFVAGCNNRATKRSLYADSSDASYSDITAANSAVFGSDNKLFAGNAFVAGYSNIVADGHGQVAFGQSNKALKANSFVAGNNNITTAESQAVVGKYCDNTVTTGDLFVVGNGTSSKRSNAFRVSAEGNAIATKLTSATSLNVGDLANSAQANNINSGWSAGIGRKLTVQGGQSLAVGYNNTNTIANTFTMGEGLKATGYCQTVLGQNNVADSSALLIVAGNNSKNALTVYKDSVKVDGNLKVTGNLEFSGSLGMGALKTNTLETDELIVGGKKLVVSGNELTLLNGLPDASAFQDGAVLVVRNGKWVIENPPTVVYTGEVK
jgi:hypothetical protein